MKKIGFIDYFLKEWHADNYPAWLYEASNGEMKVMYAFGLIDEPNGLDTNAQWCEKMGIELCNTIEEVVNKSDYLIVLSPNDAQMHLELSRFALMSKKPTFIDKTFAPTKDIAEEIFSIANEYKTPMYSSSALRFSDELDLIDTSKIKTINSVGSGVLDKYLVHQVEPIIRLMGTQVSNVDYTKKEGNHYINIDFSNGQNATITMDDTKDFAMDVLYNDNTTLIIEKMSNYFPNAMLDMVRFFNTQQSRVSKEETICIMKIIESVVLQARK